MGVIEDSTTNLDSMYRFCVQVSIPTILMLGPLACAICISTLCRNSRKRDLKLKYTIEKGAGHFDWEERSISCFPKGVNGNNRHFLCCTRDNLFTWQPQNNKETVNDPRRNRRATGKLLLDEIDKLRWDYEYLCTSNWHQNWKAHYSREKKVQLPAAFEVRKEYTRIHWSRSWIRTKQMQVYGMVE